MPSPSVTFGMKIDLIVDYGSNNTSFLYHFESSTEPRYYWSDSANVVSLEKMEVVSDL